MPGTCSADNLPPSGTPHGQKQRSLIFIIRRTPSFLFNTGKNGALHAQEPGRDGFVLTVFASVMRTGLLDRERIGKNFAALPQDCSIKPQAVLGPRHMQNTNAAIATTGS
ncbi:MAG TPA: hypothetical protein DD666_00110 [Advenella kashmirensis]|uniref:Uncharacterized protein n=1 Tax=Advenella kashmirensis TaxID=310575 RepID=A0A356L9X7_9BURK|nr:hypothetical protein [Advenella kashmirensis]